MVIILERVKQAYRERPRKGRPRIEDDSLIHDLYEAGCELLRKNPRITVAQLVPNLGISRSQWFRWKAKLSGENATIRD